MNTELNTLLENIKADYAGWQKMGVSDKADDDTKQFMRNKFNDELRYEEGRKYIKVITGTSVWGFIVKTNTDKQFRQGDILKAASWAQPARNEARGNILDGGYEIRWTGPLYLV